MSGRIAKEWEHYRDMVIPADASATQLQETRRGFYAGAYALLTITMVSLDPGSEPTESDLAMMAEIDAELKAFNQQVIAGNN